MGGWRKIISRLGVDVRPGEGSAAVLLFLCFFLFIAFQYATKSVRQATFIDELGARYLPLAYLAVAVLSLPFLWLYGRLADRVQRHRLIASTCAVIGLSMLGCWWLFQFSWDWLPFVFYVWISIVYVMNVSQFWSFSNHVLDPRQAKRLFGFVGAGGLLGGIAGGQVATLVSKVADTRSTFLVATGILMAAAALIYLVHRIRPADDDRVAGAAGLEKLDRARGGFQTIRESRHLQSIAAVMVLCVMVAQVVDLQFNWAAEEWTKTTGLDERTAFFGNFYSIMGISAFLFQLVFTARIHRVLGVGFAMRVLPVTMAVGTGALFLAAGMLPVGLIMAAYLLKMGENGLRYSLDQVTRELLFLPVPSRARLKAKAYIDVFIQRGAKGLAGLLLLLVTFGLLSELQTGWISLALVAVWLGVIVWAYREYVHSFRKGLRQRTVDTVVPINLSDVITLEILVQSLGSTDRRQVLHSLEILASHGRANLVPSLLLYHSDALVRQKTLKVLAEVGRRDAAPLIEVRLGDDDPDVRAEAIRALAAFNREDAGAMMLPRLRDPVPGVRAAAVACLANHVDEAIKAQATEALADMLSDADPGVRAEAAKAIGAIRERKFQGQLLQLLYDAEPRVVREAISAVRRRVARDGFSPLYVPTLISLLENRRLKHDARESLVAFGESAIPALVHFMNDPQEQIWVRRALPKTIARIGTPAAVGALVECLRKPTDGFLRRKVIEALGSLGADQKSPGHSARIRETIRSETQRYLQNLTYLCALDITEKARFEGPLVKWDSEDQQPSLLDQLLAERMEDHLRNLFGLLALLHSQTHIWAAHRSLLSGQPALRNHALEYLDNTLSGEVRRNVFAVIGDTPLGQKLRLANRLFSISTRAQVDTLREMLGPPRDGDEDAAAMTVAALYTVYTDKVSELYPHIEVLLSETSEPFVRETAAWVARRLDLPAV